MAGKSAKSGKSWGTAESVTARSAMPRSGLNVVEGGWWHPASVSARQVRIDHERSRMALVSLRRHARH